MRLAAALCGLLLCVSPAAAQEIARDLEGASTIAAQLVAKPELRVFGDSFASQAVAAHRFKTQGEPLRALRVLLSIGSYMDEGQEAAAVSALGSAACPDVRSYACVSGVERGFAYLNPRPATLEEAAEELFDISAEDDGDEDWSPLGREWAWHEVTGQDTVRLEQWLRQARSGATFLCRGGPQCLQLFAVAPAAVASPPAQAGDFVEPLLAEEEAPVVAVAEGAELALCEVTRIGDAVGPPERCVAILRRVGDRREALSIAARLVPPPPPPPPAPAPPPPPQITADNPFGNGAIVRVQGVSDPAWIVAKIEDGLQAAPLQLEALAKSARQVVAVAPWRVSPVLSPYRESGTFWLELVEGEMGWYVHLSQGLMVNRRNTSDRKEFVPPSLVQRSLYRRAIRQALKAVLTQACSGSSSAGCTVR